MVPSSRAPLRVDRLRALNVPRRAEVEVGGEGAPVRMRNAEKQHWVTIAAIRETWRIDDEWWREPVTRMYHEVLLEQGGRAVLIQDLTTKDWYLQAP